MDAIEALKTRRSVREFRDEPVADEILRDIVDCGRLAATAINIQPWEFIVVRDAALRRAIADATDYGKHIAQAPACIVVLCADKTYYLEDGSAATQNILVAAHARGLGTCWVAGDKKEYGTRILELLGAPDGSRLVSLIPVGHPAKVPEPPKRPLNDVLHWDRFGAQ